MSHSKKIAQLVQQVQETEHKYLLHEPRRDPLYTPWMPYQPADFIGILWECMPELEGNRFLDVGCGPGTKMDIAAALFGLEVLGIEIDQEMATVASYVFPGQVLWRDALHLRNPELYATQDLIWLYRPFRNPIKETALETLIIEHMKPGAILAGASWDVDVTRLGWNPIVDDCLNSPDGSASIIRGAWQKPKE